MCDVINNKCKKYNIFVALNEFIESDKSNQL